MSEEQTTKLKKKTTVNWKQIQKTAISVGLQVGMAFASGMALAAGQNLGNRLASRKMSDDTDGNVVSLRTAKVV